METDSGAALVDQLADLCVWGYPLVEMHRTRARQLATVGRSSRRDDLATAASRAVVAPNNDTLYASAWFDLTRGDLLLDVPPMDRTDRYWSVMLLDAYTHVQYVCRRLHGTSGVTVRIRHRSEPPIPPPSSAGGDGPPRPTVDLATPTVWVLVRVLVDGPDDLAAARRIQRAIDIVQQVESFPGTGPRSTAARPDPTPETETGPPAPNPFFADLARAVAIDPPAPGQAPAPAILDRLTVLIADPAAAPVLAEAEAAGRDRIRAAGSGADTFTNGWGTRRRGADFGDDITYRAAFARVSLAGHLPAENRGYNRGIDGTRPVVLRFPPGGDPPVDAFWSLTLYGPDLFFVANDIDRFSIGDRTRGLRRAPDGSLAITIAHDPPRDEHGRPDTANWLPAPAGPAVIVLRTYEGASDVVDATWFPPDLEPAGTEP